VRSFHIIELISTMSNEEAAQRTKTKKQLVAGAIARYCHSSSPFPILQRIASSIEGGDELVVESITAGGVTNHSYKVFLQNDRSVALYAKLAQDHASWDPSKVDFPPERLENEYRLLKGLSSAALKAPVATPYFCETLGNGMALLVTEYKENREHFATQFLEGDVDDRTMSSLTDIVARLHCIEGYDPDFNIEVYSFFDSIMEDSKNRILSMFVEESPANRVEELVREYGKEACIQIMDNMIKNIGACDCLIHNDLHVFNILTESRSNDGGFGIEGNVTVVDFELASPGPIGRDVGLILGWPIACVIWHASQGREDEATKILDFVMKFYDEYESCMRRIGAKVDAFITVVFRNVMAWAGWFLCINVCVYGSYAGKFDFQEESYEEEFFIVMESVGVVGLQLMRWGFGGYEPGLSLLGLHEAMVQTIQDEQDRLLGVDCYVKRWHRDSVLLYQRRSSCSSEMSGSCGHCSFDRSFDPGILRRRHSDVL